MTIKELPIIYLGSEFGRADCASCKSTNGPIVLYQYHNGYGEDAVTATEKQMNEIRNAAKKHDKRFPQHEVRVMFGKKESVSLR